MKITGWIPGLIMTLALTVAGCSKQASLDIASFEQSFKSAEAGLQAEAQKAVAGISTADYGGAIKQLKVLAASGKLTAEQQRAVKTLLGQVRKFAAYAGVKIVEDGDNATNAPQTAAPK